MRRAASLFVAAALVAGCTGQSPSRTAEPAAAGFPLSFTTVKLPARLPFMERGYNYLPRYTRLGVAARSNGQVLVAWPAKNGSVHVTTLSTGLTRGGPDVIVPRSAEVGGLVAHPDGFALLTRRPDANKWDETAAALIRYSGGKQKFERRLTGTSSRDTSPVLDGSLAWNGKKYGAYFVVHGAGGSADGHFGDKLAYVSGGGKKLSGGWSWGCSHNQGTALLPTKSGPFASLCFEDWRSGLFVSTGIGAPNNAPVLQREECWAGYCGGSFGNLVRSGSGRMAVVFASRGASKVTPDGTGRGYKVTAKYPTHQVAVRFMKDASTPTGQTIYLSKNSKVDHINVRAAPYGPNKILISWQNVANATCKAGTCTGKFTGTYLRLFDYTGTPLSKATRINAHIAGDIAVLPSGDLVWAFVKAKPNYTGPLRSIPTASTLTIARLAYRP